MIISYTKWGGLFEARRTDDLRWWFAVLAPELCKIQTCLCAWRQIETLIWSLESLPLFLVPLIHMFLESPGYYRPQSRLLAASLGKQRDSWAPITRPNRCSGDLQRKWMEKRNGEGREVMRKKGKPRVDGGSKKWINTLMPELRDFIRNPA